LQYCLHRRNDLLRLVQVGQREGVPAIDGGHQVVIAKSINSQQRSPARRQAGAPQALGQCPR
jgi:hypothetical protein